MKKLCFLLDWELSEGSQLATAADGHWEMVRLLSKEWDIEVFVCSKYDGIFPHKYFPIHMVPQKDMAQRIYDSKPNAILVWADLTRPTLNQLAGGTIPVFNCFSGGETDNPITLLLQGIFVESASYLDKFKSRGINAMTAFGVNDRIFKPIKQPKVWDAVFPATFAEWKRHKLFADSVERGFCFGYMYDTHETECWQYPQKHGIMIASHLSSEAVAYILNASHSCLITSMASGGSQRTVLEAMSCNILPIVMSDSDKTREYVEDSGFGLIVEPEIEQIKEAVAKVKTMEKTNDGRKYIESKWTAHHFKEAIMNGILKSL